MSTTLLLWSYLNRFGRGFRTVSHPDCSLFTFLFCRCSCITKGEERKATLKTGVLWSQGRGPFLSLGPGLPKRQNRRDTLRFTLGGGRAGSQRSRHFTLPPWCSAKRLLSVGATSHRRKDSTPSGGPSGCDPVTPGTSSCLRDGTCTTHRDCSGL